MIHPDLSGRAPTVVLPPTAETVVETPGRSLVHRLLQQSLLPAEDWNALAPQVRRKVADSPDEAKALGRLVKQGLLTKYQAGRIAAGNTFGLVLGSYRILDRLGVGGMAVVFKAEHTDLRHHVAVKVLPPSSQEDSSLESRFFAEMRTIAQLRHPNIVAATDAGRTASADGNTILRYLVMEYVAGEDLDAIVRKHGPMTPVRACAVASQVASALGETNKHGLVHRDIKPSNVMITKGDQAKLLDFGLTRHFGHRLTVPGTVLGTIDYMAPEQARDASTVDIRADLFGLGGILYWCLTGRSPFPSDASPVEALTRRLTAPAPSVRAVNPDLPAELDAVVAWMMAPRPEDRYPDPGAVIEALRPFIGSGRRPARATGIASARATRELAARVGEAEAVRNALALATARLTERREGPETGHPVRMQRYCRTLAEAAAAHSAFADRINCAFVDLLECAAPLHDIGRVGLPDHILLKPGPLTSEERQVMEAHTVLGAEVLTEAGPATGAGQAFLAMAAAIARHHHERHDGTGYPDRLAGEAIPLAARLVAVADVYDALRSRRPHRPALSHGAAVRVLTQDLPGHFDSAVFEVFQQVAGRFEAIFEEVPE
jgi:HD-GYP domain-containing protein (c-di-GMP phosphodiesterase class II)/tRNA A-37 threonylcarbamoyl transferase component Bud32